MDSLDVSALDSVGDDFAIHQVLVLVDIIAPELGGVNGSLNIQDNRSLSGLWMPSLAVDDLLDAI